MAPRALKEYGPGQEWKEMKAVEGRSKWKLVDVKPRKVETLRTNVRSSAPKFPLIDPPATDDHSECNPIPIDIEGSRPRVRKVFNNAIVAFLLNSYDYSLCNRRNRIA